MKIIIAGLRDGGKVIGLGLVALGMVVLTITPVMAQPAGAANASWKPLAEYELTGLHKQVALDLKGIDVVEAIQFFAQEHDLNIVASNQVTGTVHLYIKDVTVAQALQTLLGLNKLAYVIKGDIIQIMTEAEFKALYGIPFYDQREVRTHQLKYASARTLATMLESIKSAQGEIIYNDDTGILIIRDIPSKLQEMEAVIGGSEIPTLTRLKPTETRTFRLQYANVEEVQAEITSALTPVMGVLRTNKRTNTLIVTDLPHQLEIITDMITAFDKRTREVFIEARIVQVTLNDNSRMGIDWSELARWRLPVEIIESGVDLRHMRMSLMTLPGSSGSSSALSQNFVLDVLNNFGETKLLSDPRITVQDGHEATLRVVTSEAYEAGTSEVDSGGVTTSYRNFEFIDVGVTLSVIPKINDEDFINILIKPEVSSIQSWYGGSEGAAAPRSSGSVPIVKRSTAETTVTVKDGVTIMIGGLIDEANTVNISKFPVLGDLPGLGFLFTNKSETLEKRETIIFLTPHIVDGERSMSWDHFSEKEIKGLRE